MGFKFSRDISHIIFIITNGFQRTSELFYWTRFYLSFTEISEFGTDLNTGPMTRIWKMGDTEGDEENFEIYKL